MQLWKCKAGIYKLWDASKKHANQSSTDPVFKWKRAIPN